MEWVKSIFIANNIVCDNKIIDKNYSQKATFTNSLAYLNNTTHKIKKQPNKAILLNFLKMLFISKIILRCV